MLGNMEELRQRLELLLGAAPEPGPDLREREAREGEVAGRAQRERIAAAGGELARAALAFLGEILPPGTPAPAASRLAEAVRERLAEGLGEDAAGRPTLTLRLPDASVLEALTGSLGRILAGATPPSPSREPEPAGRRTPPAPVYGFRNRSGRPRAHEGSRL